MKKQYFVLPTSRGLWNMEAVLSSAYNTFDIEREAIAKAAELSRQYNADFYVCSRNIVISTNTVQEHLE